MNQPELLPFDNLQFRNVNVIGRKCWCQLWDVEARQGTVYGTDIAASRNRYR